MEPGSYKLTRLCIYLVERCNKWIMQEILCKMHNLKKLGTVSYLFSETFEMFQYCQSLLALSV